MGLLIITTLPSILILMYFVKGDKFPEPQDKILKTFFWGLAICLPAYIGNTLLFEVYRDLGISNILSSSFFGPAIVEEGLKFLVFLNIVYKFRDFDEPIDDADNQIQNLNQAGQQVRDELCRSLQN